MGIAISIKFRNCFWKRASEGKVDSRLKIEAFIIYIYIFVTTLEKTGQFSKRNVYSPLLSLLLKRRIRDSRLQPRLY